MALPTLMVIDVQRALDDPIYGERSTPEAERKIARAFETWRERGRPPDFMFGTRASGSSRPAARRWNSSPRLSREATSRSSRSV